MALPSERKVWQFDHATVIFTCEKDFKGRIRPKLYVQAIDQYRYQREWTLEYRHRSGDSNDMYWESHAYRHPCRRHIEEMSQSAAKRLIERFIHLTEEYPTLLFNVENERQARHEGFVHFHESLLDGCIPSVKLL